MISRARDAACAEAATAFVRGEVPTLERIASVQPRSTSPSLCQPTSPRAPAVPTVKPEYYTLARSNRYTLIYHLRPDTRHGRHFRWAAGVVHFALPSVPKFCITVTFDAQPQAPIHIAHVPIAAIASRSHPALARYLSAWAGRCTARSQLRLDRLQADQHVNH